LAVALCIRKRQVCVRVSLQLNPSYLLFCNFDSTSRVGTSGWRIGLLRWRVRMASV